MKSSIKLLGPVRLVRVQVGQLVADKHGPRSNGLEG